MDIKEFIKKRQADENTELRLKNYELEFMVIALREENERLRKEVNRNAEGIHENHMEE